MCRELGVIQTIPPIVIGGLEGLRIGLTTLDIYEETAAPGLRKVWGEARELLKAKGAVVQGIELGSELKGWSGIPGRCSTIVSAESSASLLREYKKGGESLSPMASETVERRPKISNAVLVDLFDRLAALRPRFDAIAGHFDAILTPSTSGEPPQVGVSTLYNYAVLWTGLHVPMNNIPGLCDDSGLPVGLSLVGPR